MSDHEFLTRLGYRIKLLRREKGISQVVLAEACGFDKGRMSKIEAGKKNITVITLRKIGKALKTDIYAFFEDGKRDHLNPGEK